MVGCNDGRRLYRSVPRPNASCHGENSKVSPNDVDRIRATLNSPIDICERLGLLEGSKRQARGLMIRCPAHSDRTASCSVTRGPDGTLRFRCFGCAETGDVLNLIASANGLDLKSQFQAVLEIGAAMSGFGLLPRVDHSETAIAPHRRHAGALWGNGPTTDKSKSSNSQPGALANENERRSGNIKIEEPKYPEQKQILDLWERSTPASDDTEVSGHLVFRRLDPDLITRLDLARVISQPLPRWARFKGQMEHSLTWLETGHRLLVPMWNSSGVMTSVRAWRVRDGETPKRLPPAGHRTTGLLMANPGAIRMLRGELKSPVRLVITEGESDYMTWSTRATSLPIVGVISGGWNPEFALKIPYGSEISIRTDHDQAGDKYAQEIIETVKHRAVVFRSRA